MITSNKLSEQEHDQMNAIRGAILSNNKSAREQYAREQGLEASMFEVDQGTVSYVDLPLSIYTGNEDLAMFDDDDEDSFFNTPNAYDRKRVLQGNLSALYDKI